MCISVSRRKQRELSELPRWWEGCSEVGSRWSTREVGVPQRINDFIFNCWGSHSLILLSSYLYRVYTLALPCTAQMFEGSFG